MTIPEKVDRTLRSLPNSPGVYLWKDSAGHVLYVGKAGRLRQRVRSYFAADASDDPWRALLRTHIADVETIVVPTESQALLLESNLIKEYRPRFNLQLRDDKSYPRIAVTVGEPFPRVLVVRRVQLDGARYFGPYTDVGVLRRTLRIVRRIFTVRSCHYALPTEAPDRPCLDYHIHRCKAPCTGFQSPEDYRRMIEDVLAFLEGKTVEVRRRLRLRMEEASTAMRYERAAEIRDALHWLDQLERPAAVEVVGAGDADAIGIVRDGDDVVGVLVRVRQGKVIAREHRFFQNLEGTDDAEILRAFLVGYYRLAEGRARTVALPFPPADFTALRELMPEAAWTVPQRGAKWRLVQLAEQNAQHLMESLRIESLETEERAENPVYALGRDLGLPSVPRSMVCVDISTSQGKDTVGALVWFEGGRTKKSEYRRFKVRGGQTDHPGSARPDDFAAIDEVVRRYFSRRLDEGKPIPDLTVIDGGKGQLAVAHRVMRELGLGDRPLVSLAKREEEVFLVGRGDSLKLSPRAPSLRLLQRARDEAHRFAIAYNRQQRAARTITSQLLDVPGVGGHRRRMLLERFGSLAGVRTATVGEIASLPGFSQTLANRILEHLQS